MLEIEFCAVALCVGILIQYVWPRSHHFAMTLVSRLSPLAAVNLIFFYLKSDLDIFAYGMFKWTVTQRNLDLKFQFFRNYIFILISASIAWNHFGDYCIFHCFDIVKCIETEKR